MLGLVQLRQAKLQILQHRLLDGGNLLVFADVLVDLRDVVDRLLRVILEGLFDVDKGLVSGFELRDEELKRLVKRLLLFLLQIFLSRTGRHLGVRDFCKLFVFDGSQVSLVKVVIGVQKEGRLFVGALRVVLNDEAGGIEILLAVELSLLVNVSESLVLLLDTSELNSTRGSTASEDRLGIREGNHEIIQVFLRETMAVG